MTPAVNRTVNRAVDRTTPMCRKSRGITLIELLVAVAIVAILAAVALPFYGQYQVRTVRSNAQSDLLRCAQDLERYASINFTYVGATFGAADGDLCPANSPFDGGDAQYTVAATSLTADAYTLRATPLAGALANGDGMLELDSNGDRRWDKDNGGGFGAGENDWQE